MSSNDLAAETRSPEEIEAEAANADRMAQHEPKDELQHRTRAKALRALAEQVRNARGKG
jgi:hypothetical protein